MSTPERLEGIRVVGFDLDQTLYPKSPEIDEMIGHYLYERIVEHRSVSLAEARELFTSRYLEGSGMSGGEVMRDLGLANGAELVQEALERADITSLLQPDPATCELLAALAQSYRSVDLITGSGREQARQKLAALNIPLETFGLVITDDEASKATGASYRLWLSHYPNLGPDQFVYIGDRPRSDYEIPAALGIRTVLVYVRETNPDIDAYQIANLLGLRDILLMKD
ncbi:MAG TPA: HAD family hydrolase [Candidatus Paceibacterota bacterium]